MKTKFRDSSCSRRTSLVLAVVIWWINLPSLAHGPLSEADDYHDGGSIEQDRVAATGTDLTAVRSLTLMFRETGDDRWLDEAWSLIGPAIEADSANPETLVTAAFVAQSRHEFSYALQLIRKALASNSVNDEAWLLLASISLVHGDSETAAQACGRLRKAPPLMLLVCSARVALATGDHHPALARMMAVLNAVDGQHLPAEMLAWAFSVAGDLAVAADERAQALDLYRRSLALAERTQVRAALVDVLLAEAHYNMARRALDAGAPALPLLIRRLIVARRLDRLDEFEALRFRIESQFDAWVAERDWLHAREMTRFYLDVADRPQLARRLALINLNMQREPEDLRLERRTRS